MDPLTNTFVASGGYGNHTYNTELVIHEPDDCKQKIDAISSLLSPRYLNSTGNTGNGKFPLMGGCDSASGRQEEFPKNLHDLYLIDYRNLSCRKPTEFPAESPTVYSNLTVIDSLNNNFHILKFFNDRFRSFLSSFSVDLRNLERKSFTDSIPYNFLDSESFCDIFLDKLINSLYPILLQGKGSGFYSIDVYSLPHPPLNWTDILQGKYLDNEVDSKRIVYLLLAGIGVSLILLLYFFFRPKKKISNITTSNFSDKDTTGLINREQFSVIYSLGGLQIFDSSGNDITQKFTPVIRQMFLFTSLSFIQNGKGITSERLDEAFWSGMDKDSASSSRNVNIRKSRLLLKEIGGITSRDGKNYWLLDIGSEVFIDYAMIILLLLKDKSSSNFDGRRLVKILESVSQGILLPNMITDWIDHYKSDYLGKTINFLLERSRTVEVQGDLVSMQKIADIALLHDDINEGAIRLKCIALYKLGQEGLSKSRFEKFRLDYHHLLNEYPPFMYEELIKKLQGIRFSSFFLYILLLIGIS